MRVTVSTLMRQYNNRMHSTLKSLADASARVQTGRKNVRASDSPSDTAKATKLYREMIKNKDYLVNTRDTLLDLDSAESSLSNVLSYTEEVYSNLLRAMNGTMSEDERATFAENIRNLQEAVITDMNAQTGDKYIFGGSNTKNDPPFVLDKEGNVLFRGINVDAGMPTDPAVIKQIEDGTISHPIAVLKELAEEKVYIDLGFGLSVNADNNAVTSGTAFNISMPGISFIGYGTDGSGIPNNVISLFGKIAEALDDPNIEHSELSPLLDKLVDQRKSLLVTTVKMGTNTRFLESTRNRLEDQEFIMENKLNDTVGIEPAAAITDFQYQQYVYNAVLQMGNHVLTPSFMDFMK